MVDHLGENTIDSHIMPHTHKSISLMWTADGSVQRLTDKDNTEQCAWDRWWFHQQNTKTTNHKEKRSINGTKIKLSYHQNTSLKSEKENYRMERRYLQDRYSTRDWCQEHMKNSFKPRRKRQTTHLSKKSKDV